MQQPQCTVQRLSQHRAGRPLGHIALVAAQLTGAPVIPVSAGTDRAWWLGGWDRFLIPKPFSRFQMIFDEPIFVPRDATPEQVEAAALHAERRLNEITAEVDRPWS